MNVMRMSAQIPRNLITLYFKCIKSGRKCNFEFTTYHIDYTEAHIALESQLSHNMLLSVEITVTFSWRWWFRPLAGLANILIVDYVIKKQVYDFCLKCNQFNGL